MNESTHSFESASKSIIAGFSEETGLTPLEFFDTFEDVNEFSLKSVLPITHNAILQRIEVNAYQELSEDYFTPFYVVRLSNDNDTKNEVLCMGHPNLKCALAVYTRVLTEIENGKGYHCSVWQIKLEKESLDDNRRIGHDVLHELLMLEKDEIKEILNKVAAKLGRKRVRELDVETDFAVTEEVVKELEIETKVLTKSITIECVGEHSNWKPIVDSLAKVKKLNVCNILKGYDMYLAGQV